MVVQGWVESRHSLEGSHCLGRHPIAVAFVRLSTNLDLGLGKNDFGFEISLGHRIKRWSLIWSIAVCSLRYLLFLPKPLDARS